MSTPSLSLPLRGRPGSRSVALSAIRPRPELLGLLLLAAVLDLWSLSRNGMANEYYSAAVRSMTHSWSAFLYGSFDQGGVMTVDKPPLALWVQALSARAFGFSSWSMLVPQALMGVGTVALAYDLVRRPFGRFAGTVAGLALALTPITVAISRHNNPDALLVLCCTAALWFVVRALQDGRTTWLVWSGVMVGLGFEAKMAAALMVVPGIVAAYLWVAPRGRLVALRQLAVGGVAMAVVGLAWPVLVWLTPAGSRPWVSGTSDNSIWSLIFGYNGLGRLFGQSGGPSGTGTGAGGGAPGGGAAGGVFGGDTGPLRLLNQALGGQAGWLLGVALVAGVGVLVATRLRRGDPRTGFLVAVGGAFLVTAVAFSRAEGIFHPYYVSLLAPFTAALVGAGAGQLVRPDAGVLGRVLGPAMVAAGVVVELKVLGDNTGSLTWLVPVLCAGGVVVASGLVFAPGKARAAVVAAAMGLLLIAPGAWAVQTLGHKTSSTFPAGGPAGAGGGMGGPGGGMRGGAGRGFGGPPPGMAAGQGAPPQGGFGGAGAGPTGGGGMFGGTSSNLTEAVAYATAHGGGTVVVDSQSGAGQAVIAGQDVAAIGGFSGRESQVTTAWLADAIAAGKIRYVLAGTGTTTGGRQDGRVGATAVLAAVRQVGTEVSSVSGLYDLQGKAAALRAL